MISRNLRLWFSCCYLLTYNEIILIYANVFWRNISDRRRNICHIFYCRTNVNRWSSICLDRSSYNILNSSNGLHTLRRKYVWNYRWLNSYRSYYIRGDKNGSIWLWSNRQWRERRWSRLYWLGRSTIIGRIASKNFEGVINCWKDRLDRIVVGLNAFRTYLTYCCIRYLCLAVYRLIGERINFIRINKIWFYCILAFTWLNYLSWQLMGNYLRSTLARL